MRFAAVVQPSHLHFIGFEHAPFDEQTDGLEGGVGGVHQLLTCYFCGIFRVNVGSRQSQEFYETVQLLLCPLQHVEGNVE